MRCLRALLLGGGLALALTGCRSSSDLIEAELRTKDQDLRQIRAQLEKTKAYNRYLQQEVQMWQQSAGGGPIGPNGPTPCAIRSIQLGRQTGGLDEDGAPGDEALQVVIEPRDFENHPVKVTPASLQIQALEISNEGLKRPIGAWQITPEDLRRTWRSGLLTNGYYLNLAWKAPPTTPKVRVIVQWICSDGRPFEAEKDVTVRLLPGVHQPMPPATESAPRMPSAPTATTPAAPLAPSLPAPQPGTPAPVPSPPAVLPGDPSGPMLPAPADSGPPLPAPRPIDPSMMEQARVTAARHPLASAVEIGRPIPRTRR